MEYESESSFRSMYRMDRDSFEFLLQLIQPYIRVENKFSIERYGIISTRTKLACTLRWLDGRQYLDIVRLYGIRLQTNGNTAVGLAVSQIAKVKGIDVVNVTEKSLTDFKPSGEVALCLCNASAMSKPLLKLLAPGGAFVAYSDTVEPLPSIHSVDVPVTAAIFKKVKVAWSR